MSKLEPCRSTNQLGKLSHKKTTVGQVSVMYQQLVRNQSQAGSKYFETGQSLGLASHNFSTEANPLKDFQQLNSKITLALR